MAPLAHEPGDNCRYFAVPGANQLPASHWWRSPELSSGWSRRQEVVARLEKLARSGEIEGPSSHQSYIVLWWPIGLIQTLGSTEKNWLFNISIQSSDSLLMKQNKARIKITSQ